MLVEREGDGEEGVGGDAAMDKHSIRGGSGSTPTRFMLLKAVIHSDLMGHLALVCRLYDTVVSIFV